MTALMSRLLQGLLLFLNTKGTLAAVGADGTARLDNCLIIATSEEMIELSTRTRLHVDGVGCGDLVVRRPTLANRSQNNMPPVSSFFNRVRWSTVKRNTDLGADICCNGTPTPVPTPTQVCIR